MLSLITEPLLLLTVLSSSSPVDLLLLPGKLFIDCYIHFCLLIFCEVAHVVTLDIQLDNICYSCRTSFWQNWPKTRTWWRVGLYIILLFTIMPCIEVANVHLSQFFFAKVQCHIYPNGQIWKFSTSNFHRQLKTGSCRHVVCYEPNNIMIYSNANYYICFTCIYPKMQFNDVEISVPFDFWCRGAYH